VSAPEPAPVAAIPNERIAVCQLFINGFGKQTIYTLLNFPSLFVPASPQACDYELTLHDQSGIELGTEIVTVPSFGAFAVRLPEVFKFSLPELGLMSAKIYPRDEQAISHLGVLKPYFYAMYHDDQMRSMAIVHPQSIVLTNRPLQTCSRSSFVIRTDVVDGLEIFQINPVPAECKASISVVSMDGTRLISSDGLIPGLGARRVYWRTAKFRDYPFVSLASDSMTAPNAKPLLFQHSANGFTAAHS
jgi:hypothetical protein